MEIPDILTQYSPVVLPAWQNVIKKIVHRSHQQVPYAQEAVKILEQFLLNSGKLIRPILCLYSYELFSKKAPNPIVIQLSLSLELLHNFLLIHDDIMDEGLERRGQPSLHKAFEQFHIENKLAGDPKKYGRNMAILMGDILETEVEQLWTSACLQENYIISLRQEFEKLKYEVYWGQFLDLRLPELGHLPPNELIKKVMEEKTSKYSIYRPMQLGCLLAKAAEPKWIYGFAINLGIAYQITDDMLGTFGDQKETGKSANSDIREKKLTMLVYLAFHATNEEDKPLLASYFFGNRNVSPNKIKAIYRKYAIDQLCHDLAEQYCSKSRMFLDEANLSPQENKQITQFVNFILARNK